MNVRGAPQKAGTDPREINYDLAEQATAATARVGSTLFGDHQFRATKSESGSTIVILLD